MATNVTWGDGPQYVRPEASMSVALVNDNPAAQVWGVGVQGYSRLQYTITATAQEGAAITGYEFVFGGSYRKTASGVTGPVNVTGSLRPRGQVTDSHGMSTTLLGEVVEIYPHSAPRLRNAYAYRCDENGAETEQGACLRVRALAECSPVGGRNSVTVRLRWRPVGGSYGAYVTLPNGTAETVDAALAADVNYEVELSAVDALGAAKAVSFTASVAQVTLHLKEGGDGAAFGKRAQGAGLGCAWDAGFDGDVDVTGQLRCGGLYVGGKTFLDRVYPVGAVYITLSDADPAGLFGGTWEQIRARFLLGAGSDAYDATASFPAGVIGGAYRHTLTVAELPSHSHGATIDSGGNHCHELDDRSTVSSSGSGVIESWGGGSGGRGLTTEYAGSHRHGVSIDSTGGGQAFSLMPSYLTVYMWRRTA